MDFTSSKKTIDHIHANKSRRLYSHWSWFEFCHHFLFLFWGFSSNPFKKKDNWGFNKLNSNDLNMPSFVKGVVVSTNSINSNVLSKSLYT